MKHIIKKRTNKKYCNYRKVIIANFIITFLMLLTFSPWFIGTVKAESETETKIKVDCGISGSISIASDTYSFGSLGNLKFGGSLSGGIDIPINMVVTHPEYVDPDEEFFISVNAEGTSEGKIWAQSSLSLDGEIYGTDFHFIYTEELFTFDFSVPLGDDNEFEAVLKYPLWEIFKDDWLNKYYVILYIEATFIVTISSYITGYIGIDGPISSPSNDDWTWPDKGEFNKELKVKNDIWVEELISISFSDMNYFISDISVEFKSLSLSLDYDIPDFRDPSSIEVTIYDKDWFSVRSRQSAWDPYITQSSFTTRIVTAPIQLKVKPNYSLWCYSISSIMIIIIVVVVIHTVRRKKNKPRHSYQQPVTQPTYQQPAVRQPYQQPVTQPTYQQPASDKDDNDVIQYTKFEHKEVKQSFDGGLKVDNDDDIIQYSKFDRKNIESSSDDNELVWDNNDDIIQYSKFDRKNIESSSDDNDLAWDDDDDIIQYSKFDRKKIKSMSKEDDGDIIHYSKVDKNI